MEFVPRLFLELDIALILSDGKQFLDQVLKAEISSAVGLDYI